MKKLIIYFILIFLFFLPKSAVGSEEFTIYPLGALSDNLNIKDRKVYLEFCNTMTEYHSTLNKIYMQNPIKAKSEWKTVSSLARDDIQSTRYLITKLPKGSVARTESVEWFKSLMNLVNLLESKGSSALYSSTIIDDQLKDTKKSVKDNESTKKEIIDDFLFLMNGLVGHIESFEQVDNKIDWIYTYDKGRPTLDQEFEFLKILGSNLNEAIRYFRKNNSASLAFHKNASKQYESGLEKLNNWEIGFEFPNVTKSRLSWQKDLKKKYEEYKNVKATWLKGIEFSKKDSKVLFNDTTHLKSWRWGDVSGSAIVSKYKPTIDKYIELTKYSK